MEQYTLGQWNSMNHQRKMNLTFSEFLVLNMVVV